MWGSCCFFISVACTSLTSSFCSFFEVLGTACSEMDTSESPSLSWDHFTASLASVSQEEGCQQETQRVLLRAEKVQARTWLGNRGVWKSVIKMHGE